ncbi:MAG: hypothetical protein ACRDWD_17925, partial [Acidimicrobiia bacterium]
VASSWCPPSQHAGRWTPTTAGPLSGDRVIAELLHRYGPLPIVPVQAASGGRRARKPRTERTTLVAPGL